MLNIERLEHIKVRLPFFDTPCSVNNRLDYTSNNQAEFKGLQYNTILAIYSAYKKGNPKLTRCSTKLFGVCSIFFTLPLEFELLTKSLQNKLLNSPRAHIINSQSLNTNMVQRTVEQRISLVKNFFETRSLEVTRMRFAQRFPDRPKRFGRMLERFLPTAQP